MSHSEARIRCADGAIYFAEYNGTTDVIIPSFYSTEAELSEHWRKSGWVACSDPSHTHEAAEYAGSYADGFHGPVEVCRSCMCVTDVGAFENRWDDDPGPWASGYPDWWPEGE